MFVLEDEQRQILVSMLFLGLFSQGNQNEGFSLSDLGLLSYCLEGNTWKIRCWEEKSDIHIYRPRQDVRSWVYLSTLKKIKRPKGMLGEVYWEEMQWGYRC